MGSSDVTGESWASGADMLDSGPGLYSARSSRRGSVELGRATRSPQLWERALQAVQSEEPIDGRPSLGKYPIRVLLLLTANGRKVEFSGENVKLVQIYNMVAKCPWIWS